MDDHGQHHLPVLASSTAKLPHVAGFGVITSVFGMALQLVWRPGEGGLGEMKWASSLEQLACPSSAWWQQDIDQ